MTTIDDLRTVLDDLDDFPVMEAPDDAETAVLAGMDEAVAASRSLRAVTRRRAALAAQAETEIAELERRIGMVREWLAGQDKPLAARSDYLTGMLQAYALAERARDPRHNKTLTTPYVRVTTKESPGAWRVGDEAVAWAKQYRPELVKTVESVPVSAARKEWLATAQGVFDPVLGAEVPGVVVEPSRVVATVTVLELGEAGFRG